MLMDECQHYVKEICAHIPVRYSTGAASCRRESGPGSAHCGTKFSRKRAQPKTSDLCGSVYPRLAGGSFANWARHHAAVNWMQAQPAKRPARERLPPTSRRSVRELGAASCRRDCDQAQPTAALSFPANERSRRQATCARTLRRVKQELTTRLRPGSAWSMENS